MKFQHYDSAGRAYQMSARRVSTIVRLYRLNKRRIYGLMAVESNEWDALMVRLGIPLAHGYEKAKQSNPQANPTHHP